MVGIIRATTTTVSRTVAAPPEAPICSVLEVARRATATGTITTTLEAAVATPITAAGVEALTEAIVNEFPIIHDARNETLLKYGDQHSAQPARRTIMSAHSVPEWDGSGGHNHDLAFCFLPLNCCGA